MYFVRNACQCNYTRRKNDSTKYFIKVDVKYICASPEMQIGADSSYVFV